MGSCAPGDVATVVGVVKVMNGDPGPGEAGWGAACEAAQAGCTALLRAWQHMRLPAAYMRLRRGSAFFWRPSPG